MLQFGVSEDIAYTCETAAHFWLLHVLSRWEKFSALCGKARTAECVGELFPFKEYFEDAPQPIFKAESYEKVGCSLGGDCTADWDADWATAWAAVCTACCLGRSTRLGVLVLSHGLHRLLPCATCMPPACYVAQHLALLLLPQWRCHCTAALLHTCTLTPRLLHTCP
jgi:hypothetical protein